MSTMHPRFGASEAPRPLKPFYGDKPNAQSPFQARGGDPGTSARVCRVSGGTRGFSSFRALRLSRTPAAGGFTSSGSGGCGSILVALLALGLIGCVTTGFLLQPDTIMYI